MTKLKRSINEAEKLISKQIEKGNELLSMGINSPNQLDDEREKYYRWSDFNRDLLGILFSDDKFIKEYNPSVGFISLGPSHFHEQVEDHFKDIKRKINILKSINDRLSLFE